LTTQHNFVPFKIKGLKGRHTVPTPLRPPGDRQRNFASFKIKSLPGVRTLYGPIWPPLQSCWHQWNQCLADRPREKPAGVNRLAADLASQRNLVVVAVNFHLSKGSNEKIAIRPQGREFGRRTFWQ
jgi:hypothetical protein